jgi:hypothetical protein
MGAKLETENWHLDKKVPLGIIGAIIVQTVVMVYVGTSWKDSVDNRISALEKSDSGQETHENRIVVLEQKFGYIQTSLDEIKELLKRQHAVP